MASQAAMLLDPKAYKKSLRANGTNSESSSPTPRITESLSEPVPVTEETTTEEQPTVETLTFMRNNPMNLDLDSTDDSNLLSSGTGQSSAQNSPHAAFTSSTPSGSSSVFSAHPPRSNNLMTAPATPASSDAPNFTMNTAPNTEFGMPVQFISNGDEGNEIGSNRSHDNNHDVEDSQRRHDLLNAAYDVAVRQQFPNKRMKIEDRQDNAGSRTNPEHISSDGELGQFLKEADSKPTSVAAVVDLTKDEDEVQITGSDDLQIIGSVNLSSQRVCFGKIDLAFITANIVPTPTTAGFFDHLWPTIKLTLHRKAQTDNYDIFVADPIGQIFGKIDDKTACALCPFLDSPRIELDVVARLDERQKLPNEVPGTLTAANFRVSLTLYGQRRSAHILGTSLGQSNVWLSTPHFVENGVVVFNPHSELKRSMAANAPSNVSRGRPQSSNYRYENRTVEEVSNSVTKMLNQLVSAETPRMETPVDVITPLLDHQKQALWFMTEKEKPRKFGPKEEDNNSLWRIEHNRKGQRHYKEIVSGVIFDEEPPQSFGGLLADVMGLGKTLSILSLIVSSLSQAREWEKQPPPLDLIKKVQGIRNARTTLLVAPLSTLSNWVGQIKEHLAPESISYVVFHGTSRTRSLDTLKDYDLVITTYSTVLSEVQGRSKRGESPLIKMNLFRIVLDEAHIIREPAAQQTKAILGLNSQRCWSVTGTPVQNRLEDLLSVTRFIKLFPYDDRFSFNKYIVNPLKVGNIATLRVLIDSFTLRRNKDKIHLPPREDKVIMLDFSPAEQMWHDILRTESLAKITKMDHIAGEDRSKISGKIFLYVLKAMMMLRQICAHGKELLSLQDRKNFQDVVEGVEDATLLDPIDETAEANNEKAYEMFSLMRDSSGDQCALCNKTLEEPLNASGVVDLNAPMAVYLPCADVICPECFHGLKSSAYARSDSAIKCPSCEGWIIPKDHTLITSAGLYKFNERKLNERQSRKSGKFKKEFGEYEGPHTKTLALLEKLLTSAAESEKLDGPPIKSVIFSAWTSHLDLIEIALRNAGLAGFVRLDGQMTLISRGKSLEAFATDNSVTILLATIGAGGVGLNLTSASRVYIMEPQYNPASVAQAVDRVHRLGQTRSVETVMFIMKGSFEEKVLDLARKKQQIADVSMNKIKMKNNQAKNAEERMEEFRELFKPM
ncbi:SNF2 family helicase/ATPase [Penicillium taxi]|uniref:SNF2 family helicase/ATPase n=1 Tax=Penicillium taxi TaxID=168475 RepID=UPI0025458298|nr:SNF2 family helicase/ATPase [Penicillium taxi]KAJ5899279.1 SNF2 family helicase/ATPase [Penicillium taxi]